MIFIKSIILLFLASATVAENCGPQQCTSNGELVCSAYNGNYRVFNDQCDLKAHRCEFGENYEAVPMDTCPPHALQYPRPCPNFVDWVCATPDDTELRLFINSCELSRFQETSRVRWYRIPLKRCEPLTLNKVCGPSVTPCLIGANVCGLNADSGFHQIFSSSCELRKRKCYSDGNWDKVSMIYC